MLLKQSGYSRLFLVFACGLVAAKVSARTFEPWANVGPEDLTRSAPAIAPDAPAEILFWKIEADDTSYRSERRTKAYIRYKIYDPEKSVDITRLSEMGASSDGIELRSVDFKARLTLPDGTSKEFGKEATQQRAVVKSAAENWFSRLVANNGNEVQERFMAIPGIVPGAILEVQYFITEAYPPFFYSYRFQRENIPVRHLEFKLLLPDLSDYAPRPFLLNGNTYHAELKADKKREYLSTAADNLPPLYVEPFSPPYMDRGLTLAGSYGPIHSTFMMHNLNDTYAMNASGGPWASFSTRTYAVEKDSTEGWMVVQRLARKLTAGATGELDKARRIHAYVHQHFLEYQRSSKTQRSMLSRFYSADPGDVIDLQNDPQAPISRTDFLWLAEGLYKAAGLQVQTILLPNNNFIAFDERMTSEVFLPDMCARVKADGIWYFSEPNIATPLPFGALPAENRGREGLIAQVNKSEFIPIPAAKAEDSVIRNEGKFELRDTGVMEGACTRTVTGIPAYALRLRLQNLPETRKAPAAAKILRTELKADHVAVSSIDGESDPDAPLVLHYRVRWNDYATVTKTRLVFTSSVFESRSRPLFDSTARHNDVQFPYALTITDHFSVHLPEGFALEAPAAPPSIPGKILRLDYAMTYASATRLVTTDRTHFQQLYGVRMQDFDRLKAWFDREAAYDAHELVLVRTGPAPAAAAAMTPAPPPDDEPTDEDDNGKGRE